MAAAAEEDGRLQLDPPDAPRTPLRRLGSTRKLAAFASLRASLSEQTRVLEARAEGAAAAASELAEYCRRRAELEAEYARALEKLARNSGSGGSGSSQEGTAGAAAAAAAGRHARALAREHAALGALYGGALAARALAAAAHVARLARRAKELLLERQDELAGALLAAAGAAKAHAHAAHGWRHAAAKLRDAHDRRAALAAALAAHDSTPSAKHKKLRALDKELDKRRSRHGEARARALRARADHALALEEANAALQRYYLDDVADILLCTEVGYEAAVGRVARTAAAAEGACALAAGGAARALGAAADALDAPAARRRLVASHAAFAPPSDVASATSATSATTDAEDAEGDAQALLGEASGAAEAALEAEARRELAARRAHYEAAADAARLLCQEAAKTLDAAEAELVRQMEGADVDVAKLFGAGAVAGVAGAGGDAADDTPRRDQEDYYMAKVRSYVWCAGRVSRLEARAGGGGAEREAVRGRAGRGLFAAPLAGGGERLPAVLTGCVRVIAEHGLRQQGIFRVSGAHQDVAALRAALERGHDALAACGAPDVNAVCTLLKLWLRSLRPPLLPPALQERLLAERDAPAAQLRARLQRLPAAHAVALRYLCAFLAHAAQHSARTRMDAWNLAICLGPSLLGAGGAGGAGAPGAQQVAHQNALNHLLKRLIVQHRQLFPQDLSPHTLYEPPPGAPPLPPPGAPAAAGAPGAPQEELSLYVDDDEEEPTSEEDSGGEWPPSPAPAPAQAPAVAMASPLPAARPPPPAPPRRCESSLSCAEAAGAAGGQPQEEPPATPTTPACAEPAPRDPQAPPSPLAAPPPDAADDEHCYRRAADAPDLVLGLPARAPALAPAPVLAPALAPDQGPEASPPAPSAPDADPADAFAHNRDTLKKRPTTAAHTNTVDEGAGEAAPPLGEGKPPAPARPPLLPRPHPHPQPSPPPGPPGPASK